MPTRLSWTWQNFATTPLTPSTKKANTKRECSLQHWDFPRPMPNGCVTNSWLRRRIPNASQNETPNTVKGTSLISTLHFVVRRRDCEVYGTFGRGRVSLAWSHVTCYKNPMTFKPVKLLDVVALLDDKPAQGLASGQVGTIVEVLAPDVFEVEFLDANGRTIGLGEFHRNELLLLRHEPAMAV